jgi:hypothetical protein
MSEKNQILSHFLLSASFKLTWEQHMPLAQTPSPRLPLPQVAAEINFGPVKRPVDRMLRTPGVTFIVAFALICFCFWPMAQNKIYELGSNRKYQMGIKHCSS